MNLKQNIILIGLDILIILLAIFEIFIGIAVLKYDSNNNMKYLFIFIMVICFILIKDSIKCIKNKEI